jgi:MerR family transcriptional regulator, light-induced transcriptional regulator
MIELLDSSIISKEGAMAGLKHDDVGVSEGSSTFWPRHAPPHHQPQSDTVAWVEDSPLANERARLLTRTIETEIIPRLLLANTDSQQRVVKTFQAHRITQNDVAQLADLVLREDLHDAIAHIDGHLDRGVLLEKIFLDLLAPAARRLGQYWVDDTCNFADVTIGMSRLQQLLRIYGPDFERDTAPCHGQDPSQPRRLLLVPIHSEHHTFGVSMLELFLRRAGWDITSAAGMGIEEIKALVARERFAVICISKSCDALLDQLASDIRAIRRASRNKSVGVMVGGPAFARDPDRVALVGADGTAADARQAVLNAERFAGTVIRR